MAKIVKVSKMLVYKKVVKYLSYYKEIEPLKQLFTSKNNVINSIMTIDELYLGKVKLIKGDDQFSELVFEIEDLTKDEMKKMLIKYHSWDEEFELKSMRLSQKNTDLAIYIFNNEPLLNLKIFCEKSLRCGHVENAEIWKLYGISLAELGEIKKSQSAFRCAHKLDPKDLAVMLNLMTSYFQAGKGQDGLNVLSRSLNYVDNMMIEPIQQNLLIALNEGIISLEDIPEKINLII